MATVATVQKVNYQTAQVLSLEIQQGITMKQEPIKANSGLSFAHHVQTPSIESDRVKNVKISVGLKESLVDKNSIKSQAQKEAIEIMQEGPQESNRND